MLPVFPRRTAAAAHGYRSVRWHPLLTAIYQLMWKVLQVLPLQPPPPLLAGIRLEKLTVSSTHRALHRSTNPRNAQRPLAYFCGVTVHCAMDFLEYLAHARAAPGFRGWATVSA